MKASARASQSPAARHGRADLCQIKGDDEGTFLVGPFVAADDDGIGPRFGGYPSEGTHGVVRQQCFSGSQLEATRPQHLSRTWPGRIDRNSEWAFVMISEGRQGYRDAAQADGWTVGGVELLGVGRVSVSDDQVVGRI